MPSVRAKNAVFANCGEWKTLWRAKCQQCGVRDLDLIRNKPPFLSLFLSLERPGWSSRKTELRQQLKAFSAEMRAGHELVIDEAQYNQMIELIKTRPKRVPLRRPRSSET